MNLYILQQVIQKSQCYEQQSACNVIYACSSLYTLNSPGIGMAICAGGTLYEYLRDPEAGFKEIELS
jgi:hypothetical protein